MKPLNRGDKVMVVGPVPPFITAQCGVYGGEIGEVIKVCKCLADMPEEIREQVGKLGLVRIHLADSGKFCMPRRLLRKIEDDDEDNFERQKPDWSKIPKPWEINVKG